MITREQFQDFATSVEILREDILKTEYPPDLKKTGPVITIGNAAKILDVPRTQLQKLVREEKIECTLNEKGNRSFTLKQLDDIRHYLQKTATKKNYVKSRPSQTKKPFVISVSNLKGGSSKTTTAIHLAQGLALEGYKVAALESDPQGSFGSLMGFLPFEPSEHNSDIDANFVDADDTLLYLYDKDEPIQPLKTYWHNLDVTPANIRLFDTEFLLPLKQSQDENFKFFDVLNQEISNSAMTDFYDIIIIDCPPSFSYLTYNAIYAADALLVPIPPNHLDILATGAFFDQLNLILEAIEDNYGYKKEFEFVAGLKTRMDNETESLRNGERISEIFGKYVLNHDVITSKAIKAASDKNMTLFELDIHSEAVARRTYQRALDSINSVNKEIEEKIIEAWQRQVQTELDLGED